MAITSPPHRSDTVEAYQTAVERVIQHMNAHLEDPLDLDELARIAAISKFHLVRVFNELTGTTPRHFLACLRVQKAKERLLRSQASITDVCLEVGYSSLGTFSTTFNSLVGMSPQEFRALPKRLNALQFAGTVWRYLAARHQVTGPQIEGLVEAPGRQRGFTFVGAFEGGVPQGIPYSGTILLGGGAFRISRPEAAEFHLLAALIPFSANLAAMMTNLPVKLVASLRLRAEDAEVKPILRLRPLRLTDPPIVLALPALPPLAA